MGRTEPDLDLIKQVEQVTISALERPAWRFAAIPSDGIADAVEVLVFLIWQLLRWLLFGCKNSQERPRATCLRRFDRGVNVIHPPALYGRYLNGCVDLRSNSEEEIDS
jgi:hypothetical protein